MLGVKRYRISLLIKVGQRAHMEHASPTMWKLKMTHKGFCRLAIVVIRLHPATRAVFKCLYFIMNYMSSPAPLGLMVLYITIQKCNILHSTCPYINSDVDIYVTLKVIYDFYVNAFLNILKI